MRIAFFIITALSTLVALPHESCAQKEKRVEVFKNKILKDFVDVFYQYDASNTLTSTHMILYGQDVNYHSIVKMATIYTGTPKEFMKFLNDVEKFIAENGDEANVSSTIDGRRVVTTKLMGMKGFLISGQGGFGDRGYNTKSWGKIKAGFSEWATKSNLPIE